MLQHFDTLEELTAAFPDEQSCIRHFRAIRWTNGPFCPYCSSTKIYNFSDDKTHKCGDCRQRFSIKVGTIFEDTKLPLRKWFIAIWLITSYKKGIASTQLARDLGVTQKTAWFMLHQLREAAKAQSFNKPLAGEVEADETYVGGKAKNKHKKDRTGKRGTADKTPVLGVVSRKGDVVTRIVANADAKVLKAFVREVVGPEATLLATDDHAGYAGLSETYPHKVVRHSAGEYVSGNVHTQTIDGYWSQLKRQIFGIHHWVSTKHLHRYAGESAWRYNRRSSGEGDRVNALLSAADGKRLRYDELIK